MNGRGAAPGAALFLPAAVKKAERRRAARPRAPWPAIPPAGTYPSGPSCPDGRSCLGGLPRPVACRTSTVCHVPADSRAPASSAPHRRGETARPPTPVKKRTWGFPLSAGAGASKGSQGTAFPKFHRVFNIPVENGAWFSPIQHSSAAQMHIKLSVSAYFGFKW